MYLRSCVAGDTRYDLDSKPAGIVTETERPPDPCQTQCHFGRYGRNTALDGIEHQNGVKDDGRKIAD